jgi:exo-1,4-beta-D-glucosaminidase
VTRTTSGTQQTATITLTNTGSTLAFFLRPEITAGNGGNEVLPVSYSDNYVSLFPGESTTITASYATSALGGAAPYLRVRGVNVPTSSIVVP